MLSLLSRSLNLNAGHSVPVGFVVESFSALSVEPFIESALGIVKHRSELCRHLSVLSLLSRSLNRSYRKLYRDVFLTGAFSALSVEPFIESRSAAATVLLKAG